MARTKQEEVIGDPFDELNIAYWDGRVRITEKGWDHDLIQGLLDTRGKECTTCKIHQPFNWFGKDKKGKLNNRCKACSRAARNSSYVKTKKETRAYNKAKEPDLEFWDQIDAYIDSMCARYRFDRDKFIEELGNVTDRCMVSVIMNFQVPEGDDFFKRLRQAIPDVKDAYKRGEEVQRKFSYVKEWAANMTEATAREVILSYKDGIKHKKTLVRAAIYKLNRKEIDSVTGSDNQQFNILNEMLRSLVLV